MLTCIACSKQLGGGSLPEQEEDDTGATPRSKPAIKALTSQIKDMAVKASGAYKNCKPCSGSSNHNRTNDGYADSEAGSGSDRFHCGYQRTCNSTPRVWGKEMEARLKGLSSGGSTPASYSDRIESVKFIEEDELKEWVAQVEPGVLITFHSLPQGGNDLKHLSAQIFSRMNPQQVAQPRSSANGFTRRRGEKETGTRVDNKSQPGKSHFNRVTTSGGVESPSRDRLVYITACLIGHQVEVQVIDGTVFSGIFHATNAEKDFGIILKMARVTKAGSSRGQKNISDSVQKPPSKTLIIPAKELVQIVAKSVSVTRDGLMNEVQHEEMQDIMIDSSISQSRHVDLERELAPWVPDDDNPECPELDNTFDRHWNRGWDQFEANAALFGVKSTFNEELYTTKLDRGPQMRELEREALRIAREIEGEDTHDLHLAEERGIHFNDKFDLDEETKYSSVFRGGVDDSGYDESEDVFDSQNSETFGDVVNENELYPSGPLDVEIRIQDNQTSQQHPDTEKHMLYEQRQSHGSKSEESSLWSNKEKESESGDKGLNATATAYAPPSKSKSKSKSKAQEEKTTSTSTSTCSQVSEGVKTPQPGVATSASASSASESGNASPAPAPGLSPTSSMGSLTSEKSTLNPHAKEFRLNPNAKSFVPSAAPVRAASPPVSDGSFYYPPHMHGMPLGIGMGMGPAFPAHQPVIFGPQGTPLQSPQTYFHSNAPQYGQQMLVGQPRQVVYMPTYPPEMPYKGREF
ncbi:unnamed protein product [Lactuca saligna]|uniref:BRX domain-containing protein n=1 Tax=Lactuca saligna TaxID=75948 RepID=A0AA36E8L8_LACSI|nr:unnamed protein product [Lactuca saligna]